MNAVFWAINERYDVERQVVRAICYKIARGAWMPNDSIPPPHVLAKERILSPRVVESAYTKLVKDGLLVALSGGVYQTAGDAQALARVRLLEWVGEEVRDLVSALRRAGLDEEHIQRILGEAADA
jgi:DNA-binding transcriptional regulator YhcF (GntR family)